MTVLIVVETVILLILCVLVAGLLRAYATVLRQLHTLDGGAPMSTPPSAPPFRTADGVMQPAPARSGSTTLTQQSEWGPGHDILGEGLNGEVISVRVTGTGLDTVLVFLSSGCAGCSGFWEDFAQRREMSIVGSGRVLVITKDAGAESIGLLRELCPSGVDLVMSSQAWEDYAVPGSPYVVVVDGGSDTIKGEGSGTSLTQVSGLVYQSRGDLAARRDGPILKPRKDADREVDVDRVLLTAGIAPGHASLYSTGNDETSSPGPELIGFPTARSETAR
jgi:hypothetical protein